MVLVLVGCGNSADEEISPELILTAAVETVQAGLTATADAQPTATLTPVPSNTPTSTPVLTATGMPTRGAPPAASQAGQSVSGAVTVVGDMAAFVSDVTIPDGTTMEPDTDFTKTWELQNSGTNTWTADYDLVYYSGSAMSGPASQQLTTDSIAPGESLYVSVELTAPSTEGNYVGYWILRNASGQNFGISSYGNPFYVEINVVDSDGTDTPTPTATSTSDDTSSTAAPTSTTIVATVASTSIPTEETALTETPILTETASPEATSTSEESTED